MRAPEEAAMLLIQELAEMPLLHTSDCQGRDNAVQLLRFYVLAVAHGKGRLESAVDAFENEFTARKRIMEKKR